ncbi:hypothetical protein R1flu_000062 [Riccia fluitans]|uniref:Uncharacterized protein n=1 Tax=Riccia fluitans TaxID=41844 RepID=A0ABD1XZE2_9MARC
METRRLQEDRVIRSLSNKLTLALNLRFSALKARIPYVKWRGVADLLVRLTLESSIPSISDSKFQTDLWHLVMCSEDIHLIERVANNYFCIWKGESLGHVVETIFREKAFAARLSVLKPPLKLRTAWI